MEPCRLTASEALALISRGELSCEELTRSCIARIEKREALVKAWISTDFDLAIAQARRLDQAPARGKMHGLPFGVKDIIETRDFPTTCNSPLYRGGSRTRDAACVAIMKAEGGVVLGKTDTVEFASSGRRALSRNPRNPDHTPGGSSSGSAAAVADGMVPLALGTQTGGSLIRPAAYTGIHAFKPSWPLVSREGVKVTAVSLDTVGWYGRSVDDLLLVADVFRLLHPAEISLGDIRVAVCRTPVWSQMSEAGRVDFEATVQRLTGAGVCLQELRLPSEFDDIATVHRAIAYRENGRSFLPEYLDQPELLFEDFKDKVENRKAVSDERLLAAYVKADTCRLMLDRLLDGKFDAVLVPAATGLAPRGLEETGSSIFNGLWTLLHVPCVGLPTAIGDAGLPFGIQLIGARLSDARLLAAAKLLAPIVDTVPAAFSQE